MFNVLYRTIDGNKEPLFLRVYRTNIHPKVFMSTLQYGNVHNVHNIINYLLLNSVKVRFKLKKMTGSRNLLSLNDLI